MKNQMNLKRKQMYYRFLSADGSRGSEPSTVVSTKGSLWKVSNSTAFFTFYKGYLAQKIENVFYSFSKKLAHCLIEKYKGEQYYDQLNRKDFTATVKMKNPNNQYI